MKLSLLHTKHKALVKPDIESEIIWGSTLFVNAQIILSLISKLSKYKEDKVELQNIFDYANAIKARQKIKLYKELQQEIDEICFLEKEIKEGEIKIEDKNIINFVFDSIIVVFTGDIPRKN